MTTRPTVLDFDIQVVARHRMPIGSACRRRPPPLPVRPSQSTATLYREKLISLPVGQGRPARTRKSNPSPPRPVTVRKPCEAGVNHGLDVPSSAEPWRARALPSRGAVVPRPRYSLLPEAGRQVMQRADARPKHQTSTAAGRCRTEAVRRSNPGSPMPNCRCHIDGDDRSVVVGFDLSPDVSPRRSRRRASGLFAGGELPSRPPPIRGHP